MNREDMVAFAYGELIGRVETRCQLDEAQGYRETQELIVAVEKIRQDSIALGDIFRNHKDKYPIALREAALRIATEAVMLMADYTEPSQ